MNGSLLVGGTMLIAVSAAFWFARGKLMPSTTGSRNAMHQRAAGPIAAPTRTRSET